MNRFKVILVVLIFSIISLFTIPVNAQFKTNTIKNTMFLEFNEKEINFYPKIRYNRVEGFYLGAGIKLKPKFLTNVTLVNEGGYGLENKEWRYRFGFYKDIYKIKKLRIGAYAFHQTASLDDWYVGTIENSLAALIFTQDYMNYFSKQGFKVFANQIYLKNHTQLRVEVANYDYGSMERKTHWAIFNKDKKFTENSVVTEGNETSIKFMATTDNTDNPLHPNKGMKFNAIYEYTLSDSTTHGIFLIFRTYQPTVGIQQINSRFMVGARVGSKSEQHLLDLGGLGTLPGFNDKEYKNGNRFLLYSFRYEFNGSLLKKVPLSFLPIWDALNLSLFFNSGWLYSEDTAKNIGSFSGFEKLQIDKLKTDVGVSLSLSDNMFLVNFAKRTDRYDDSWRIIARMMYKF